ncbi:MAG: TIGR03663 family protein [Anaerolineae bacterium]
MATITDQPTYPSYTETAANPLSRLLSRPFVLNLEIALYVVIFLMAIFTRFYNLGDRVMSHDESLHTRFSWNLYHDGSFQHTPLMHGPVLFHAVAFSYFLFGDNDFTARIYTAVLGVGMVMFPLLFRRWLGRTGAVLASLMILISPLLMYYNRYIREDTPSIFYTLIMVYCTFMYLNGPESQRRKAHWLYIFSGAMLLSLASKEVAFMYIGTFGLFLLLYWIVRMAQHYIGLSGKTWFYVAIIGVLLAGIAALGMYIILDIIQLDRITANTASPVEVSSFVTWTLLVVTLVLTTVLVTLMWAFRSEGVSFGWLDAGFMAFITALVIVGALLNLWVAAFFLGLLLSLGYAFTRLRPTRGPWNLVVILVLVTLVVCLGLIILEEASHVAATPETSTAPIPGEGTEVAGTGLRPWLLYVEWAGAAAVVGLVIFLKRRGIWAQFKRFPEFDMLILMGSLVLPWLTAIFMKGMGANPTSAADVGRVVAAALGLQTGFAEFGMQVFLGSLTLIPLAIVAIFVGMSWDARRWLISAVVFHVLFAFFFTTVFTNINGLATGMIGSLGYWLEQQGVRRGSQPQYYYLAIVLPFYEFLPIIGSVLAMFAGMTLFWRHIRARVERENPLISEASETPVEAADVIASEASDVPADELPSVDEMLEPEKAKHDFEFAESAWENANRSVAREEWLGQVPFLLFVSWWTILILIFLTLAGEKMPWLGTHMTTPMILLTAWFFGDLLDKVDVGKFFKGGWMLLLAFPVLFVALFNVVGPFFNGRAPFAGLEQLQLQDTYTWLAVLALGGGTLWFIWWLGQRTDWKHLRVMFGVAAFIALAVITFRSAWISSFINYDYAVEPLVYAHSAPAVKTVLNQIEELSFRTTDGMGMLFAYDDLVSWPYSWYFRNFTNARFMPSSSINAQTLNGAVVVVVGEENRSAVEPLLGDNYYRYEYIRMWWPLQDYFNLTADRVINAFDMRAENAQAPEIRQGLFNIWWNRDYTTYSQAVGSDLAVSRWPVRHRMYVYVRRDVIGQVWNLGTGDTTGLQPETDQANMCVSNWQELSANLVFGTQGSAPSQLSRPIGLTFGTDGNIYIAEEGNNRVSVFDPDGNFIRTIGQLGSRDVTGPYFTRPNDVAFGPDGVMYVVDTWNYRIQAFALNGTLINAWGQPAESGANAPSVPVDGFWGPRDAVVDSEGYVYVADTGNKRVRVYTAQGTYVRDIGSAGSGDGQLDEPVGLAIDNERHEIYVAEWWNQRVSVFSLEGVFQRSFEVRAWYEEYGNRPYLAVDSARGLVYVTDPDAGRVMVYSTQGNCVGAFGQSTRDIPDASHFFAVGGIALDAAGNVYVTDSGSGRVLRFPPFIQTQAESETSVEVTPEVTGETTAEVTVETTPEVTEEQTAEPTVDVTPEVTPEMTAEASG